MGDAVDAGHNGTEAAGQHHPLWVLGPAAAVVGWVAAWAWLWPWAWPLAVATHAGWVLLWRSAPNGWAQAAVGLAFGLGLHAHGHTWLWGALTTHAQAGVPWALLGTTGAVGYLAAYHAAAAAFAGWLARHTRTSGAWGGLWLGACGTAAEWLRSLPWSGMSGLSLGHAVLDTPALGWLPVVGVYGVSAGVWAVAVALAAVAGAWQRPQAWLALCGVAGGVWGGGALASHATWTVPVPSAQPWRFHLLGAPTARQMGAVARQLGWLARLEAVSADLVLTPETAMPTPYAQWGPDTAARLWALSQRTGGHLFVGTLAEGHGGLYNSVLVWGPPGVVRPRLAHTRQRVAAGRWHTRPLVAWPPGCAAGGFLGVPGRHAHRLGPGPTACGHGVAQPGQP